MKIEKNVAYWCKTEQLAKKFLKECDKQGYLWVHGDRPTTVTRYNDYKKITCYFPFEKNGFDVFAHRNKDYFEKYSYKIVEYKGKQEEYPTIVSHIVKDNKVIVKLSNGKVGISKCHPEDKFDIEIGTKLAVERAYGIEKKENNEEKFVKVIDARFCFICMHTDICTKFPEYKRYFKEFIEAKNNKIYKYIGNYQLDDGLTVLYIIQEIETKQVYTVNRKGCKFVDKPKEKEKFVPYLYFIANGEKVGNIGEETDIVDFLGNKLYVGDTVMLYRNKQIKQEIVITEEGCNNFSKNSKNDSILNLFCTKWNNGIRNDEGTIYHIIKNRKYNEIKNREVIDTLTYVLEEQL